MSKESLQAKQDRLSKEYSDLAANDMYRGGNWPSELPFECGPGWINIIEPLLVYCRYKNIKVGQIKEKYGQLRFYYDYERDPILDELVDIAENASLSICEMCGEPGILRDDLTWHKTLCDEHYKAGK